MVKEKDELDVERAIFVVVNTDLLTFLTNATAVIIPRQHEVLISCLKPANRDGSRLRQVLLWPSGTFPLPTSNYLQLSRPLSATTP